MKQLEQLDGLDIAFAGLVFDKNSPRYAGNSFAKGAIANADLDIRSVGVFTNADYDEIMTIAETYGLDMVQLHGNESPELCEQLSDELEVIKAFSIGEHLEEYVDDLIMDYDEVCDYYLFDSFADDRVGGTGHKFDWKKIVNSKIEKPFFISGGIQPADGPLLKGFKHPDFYAVDINSRFEKEPGVKDMSLVLQFIHSVKK